MQTHCDASSRESEVGVDSNDSRHRSGKCSTCGRTQYSRINTRHVCKRGLFHHGDIHPSLDLLHTAVIERSGVAGGLRFVPGAFQHDVMMILYEPAMAARSEPNRTSCVGELT
jgi:hypothetical protein